MSSEFDDSCGGSSVIDDSLNSSSQSLISPIKKEEPICKRSSVDIFDDSGSSHRTVPSSDCELSNFVSVKAFSGSGGCVICSSSDNELDERDDSSNNLFETCVGVKGLRLEESDSNEEELKKDDSEISQDLSRSDEEFLVKPVVPSLSGALKDCSYELNQLLIESQCDMKYMLRTRSNKQLFNKGHNTGSVVSGNPPDLNNLNEKQINGCDIRESSFNSYDDESDLSENVTNQSSQSDNLEKSTADHNPHESLEQNHSHLTPEKKSFGKDVTESDDESVIETRSRKILFIDSDDSAEDEDHSGANSEKRDVGNVRNDSSSMASSGNNEVPDQSLSVDSSFVDLTHKEKNDEAEVSGVQSLTSRRVRQRFNERQLKQYESTSDSEVEIISSPIRPKQRSTRRAVKKNTNKENDVWSLGEASDSENQTPESDSDPDFEAPKPTRKKTRSKTANVSWLNTKEPKNAPPPKKKSAERRALKEIAFSNCMPSRNEWDDSNSDHEHPPQTPKGKTPLFSLKRDEWLDSPKDNTPAILTQYPNDDDNYIFGDSPPKATKGRKKKSAFCMDKISKEIMEIQMPTLGFLASLTENTYGLKFHPKALEYKKNFEKKREELTQVLFEMFNSKVFGNRLPKDMQVTWNGRLTSSAGLTYQSRKIINGEWVYTARIALSKSILTTPARLRDTLIHEMCHAAVWVLDRGRGGHGSEWKRWTNVAMTVFPELPPISTCHSYSRAWKFTYECEDCGYTIGRMIDDLDVQRYRCGVCKGVFKQKGEGEAAAGKKKAGPFATFVKENYSLVKTSHPALSHKEIMGVLSTKFKNKGSQVVVIT